MCADSRDGTWVHIDGEAGEKRVRLSHLASPHTLLLNRDVNKSVELILLRIFSALVVTSLKPPGRCEGLDAIRFTLQQV